jgi:hypothetical protein
MDIPQPIILNTSAPVVPRKSAILGIAIGFGLVWWYLSSKSDGFDLETPDGERPKGVTPAVFNRNPGNLKKGKFLYPEEVTPPLSTFRKFRTWSDGYAGLIIHFRRYAAGYIDKNKLDTIRKILNTYAPPHENNTQAYIGFVCKETGFNADQKLNFYDKDTCWKMCKAFAMQEDGKNNLDDAVIHEAFGKAARFKITK